jgi:hypothetical protein
VRAFQVAMTDERIPADSIERVVNRVVYGDPRGPHIRNRGRQHENDTIEAPATIHIHITHPVPGSLAAAMSAMRQSPLLAEAIGRRT